jgi:elongation factor P
MKGGTVVAASELRKGSKVLYKGEPYSVVEYHHVKPGKGGAFIRTKMRNLITGLVHEDTFRAEEKLPSPDLEYHSMRYLYQDNGLYHFMDEESYEEAVLDREQVNEVVQLLKDQAVYTVLYFNGQPIAVTPPLFMELTVVDTVPGVRGDTAQGGATKPATLETGLVVQVPLFVNEGDTIKLDTRDERYIERVLKK